MNRGSSAFRFAAGIGVALLIGCVVFISHDHLFRFWAENIWRGGTVLPLHAQGDHLICRAKAEWENYV